MLFLINILERPIKHTLVLLTSLLLIIVAFSLIIMFLGTFFDSDTVLGAEQDYLVLTLRRVFIDLTFVTRVLLALGFLLLIGQTIYRLQGKSSKFID